MESLTALQLLEAHQLYAAFSVTFWLRHDSPLLDLHKDSRSPDRVSLVGLNGPSIKENCISDPQHFQRSPSGCVDLL